VSQDEGWTKKAPLHPQPGFPQKAWHSFYKVTQFYSQPKKSQQSPGWGKQMRSYDYKGTPRT
jgi:hypothetical protein